MGEAGNWELGEVYISLEIKLDLWDNTVRCSTIPAQVARRAL